MSIYTSDDSKVGDIKQVVIDPVTSKITHVIVEQGFILTTDKVLPVEYIVRQVDGALYLDRSADVLNLRDYEETFYVDSRNPDVEHGANSYIEDVNLPQSTYYYPPLSNGGYGMYYWGLPTRVLDDTVKEVKRINVPEGSLVIEEGVNVYSQDGDHVGDVYSVHIDNKTNRITHFIISQGLLFRDYKLIPGFWVSQVNEDGVKIAVSTEQLEKLPAHEPESA